MAEPYCIARYDTIEKNVICYEHTEAGIRRLTGTDRMNKKECIHCPQLTEAIDMLVKEKKETNGRWR